MQRPVRPGHAVALAFALLVPRLACAGEVDSAREALEQAQDAVAVVRVRRGDGWSHGSAAIVARRAVGADEEVDLVTCFHVLEGAIEAPRVVLGARGAILPDGAPVLVAGFPDLDLAVLRVPLRAGAKVGRPLTLRPATPPGGPPPAPEQAHAVAYPGYAGGAALFGVPLLAQGERNAAYLLEGLGVRASDRPGALPRGFDVGFLTGSTVAPGMSGGPVLGADGQVLGLVWARLPDVGLMLPARAVAQALARVGRDVQFAPFARAAFALPETHWLRSPALQAARRAAPAVTDALEWGGLDGVIAFVDEPAALRRRFQEVDLVAAIASGTPVHLALPPAPGDSTPIVRAWLNGHETVLVGAGAAWRVDDKLAPGENLLVLHVGVAADPGGRVELRRALRSRRLDVDLCAGDTPAEPGNAEPGNAEPGAGAGEGPGEPFFRLRRSLPALVSGYAVFVTLRTPAPAAADAPRGAARLALRLDEVQTAVRARLPLDVPLRASQRTAGRLVIEAADLVPDGGAAAIVNLAGRLTLDRVALGGLEARLPPVSEPLPLRLVARVAAVRRTDAPGVALSVRVTEVRLGRRIDVPVLRDQGGLEVDLDVTAMLEALILGWVNNVLLSAEPRPLEAGALLGLLGGAADATPPLPLHVRDLRLSEDGRWVVATLADGGAGGLLGPLPSDACAGEVAFAPIPGRAELYRALAGATFHGALLRPVADPESLHVVRVGPAQPRAAGATEPSATAASDEPWADLVERLRAALRAEVRARRWSVDLGSLQLEGPGAGD